MNKTAMKMTSSSFSLKKTIGNISLSGKLTSSGRVNKYDGHFLECDGFPANLGSICSVATSDGATTLAEIIVETHLDRGELSSRPSGRRASEFFHRSSSLSPRSCRDLAWALWVVERAEGDSFAGLAERVVAET